MIPKLQSSGFEDRRRDTEGGGSRARVVKKLEALEKRLRGSHDADATKSSPSKDDSGGKRP
jgi:hypothetical protein